MTAMSNVVLFPNVPYMADNQGSESRFQPYGGAGDLPTSCCKYAVVDTETGVEICRVWDEDDARKIANLLQANLKANGMLAL